MQGGAGLTRLERFEFVSRHSRSMCASIVDSFERFQQRRARKEALLEAPMRSCVRIAPLDEESYRRAREKRPATSSAIETAERTAWRRTFAQRRELRRLFSEAAPSSLRGDFGNEQTHSRLSGTGTHRAQGRCVTRRLPTRCRQWSLRARRHRIATSSFPSGWRPRSISRASMTKSPPGERIGVPPLCSPSA